MGTVIELMAPTPKRQNRAQHTGDTQDTAIIWLPTGRLGPMIRRARRRRGWSQETLNALAGVYEDAASLAKVERGEKDIEYQGAGRVAEALRDPMILAYANWLVHQVLRGVPCAEGPEVA